jgi:hypothetical protein
MSEQAPAALMERLAGHFSGLPQGAAPEQGQETEAVAETTEENTEVVDDGFDVLDWEGQSLRIPKTLKEAAMRHEDYTRKTQEIGEQRKSLEQVQSIAELQRQEHEFVKSVENERHELYMIDQYLKQFSSLNWSTMNTEEIMRHRIEMDNAKDRRAAVADAMNGKQRKFMEELQSKLGELRGKTRELSSKSIQGFSEETEKTIRDFAKSEGLADREIDNVLLDPRSVKILWKASQFDKIKAGTAKAGETADRVLRPGTAERRMPKETIDKLNFGKKLTAAKGKSSQAVANVIEDKLARGLFKGHK